MINTGDNFTLHSNLGKRLLSRKTCSSILTTPWRFAYGEVMSLININKYKVWNSDYVVDIEVHVFS